MLASGSSVHIGAKDDSAGFARRLARRSASAVASSWVGFMSEMSYSFSGDVVCCLGVYIHGWESFFSEAIDNCVEISRGVYRIRKYADERLVVCSEDYSVVTEIEPDDSIYLWYWVIEGSKDECVGMTIELGSAVVGETAKPIWIDCNRACCYLRRGICDVNDGALETRIVVECG